VITDLDSSHRAGAGDPVDIRSPPVDRQLNREIRRGVTGALEPFTTETHGDQFIFLQATEGAAIGSDENAVICEADADTAHGGIPGGWRHEPAVVDAAADADDIRSRLPVILAYGHPCSTWPPTVPSGKFSLRTVLAGRSPGDGRNKAPFCHIRVLSAMVYAAEME